MDTDGARVVMKATIEGRGKMLPDHMHMPQNEFYEIISGTMTVWQDRKLSQLPTGEKVPLARGRPRNHYNDADTLLTYIHSVTPALDFYHQLEMIPPTGKKRYHILTTCLHSYYHY